MLIPRNILFLQRRWKGGKMHWSVLQRKKFAKDRALENFDDFYGSVFGNRWKSMRAALLTEHKYIALVNNFGDTEQTANILELEGAINVGSLVNLAKQRFEEIGGTTTLEDKVYKMEQKLDRIIEKQEEREMSSFYPPPADISNKTANRVSKIEEKPDIEEELVDYKKPLEKVLEEDVDFDQGRLIDSTLGTGPLYDFVPATQIKGMEDWIPESHHYKYYSTNTDFPMSVELEKDFDFPKHLLLYSYEKGNCSEFIPPKKCVTGVLSHFLFDGASILPPLLLDVKQGENVLDACAAPGGKSLLMLQTLHPNYIVCNDVQESRVNRIKALTHQYICDFDSKWKGKRCVITQHDARTINDYEMYDKILVDVPCTTDRHAVTENDNNIFKPSRIKERLRLPELQSAILSNCIRLLKPGGSLIYSTCSLSPIQNDGVVHMSLQKVFNDYGITATVKDLSLVTKFFEDIFKFENPRNLKYGQLIIPFLPANFGPMYFCKLTRN